MLNTIALVEAELAKPEYFGFLIERDKVGYLEALSKTKTTFRGINPHDPLDGIVANDDINPDFVMMLEKNFFKENSRNLDIDELNFVRYEAKRNKMIKWLQNRFKELSIDDEYLKKELGFSKEKLFQGLQENILVFAMKVENGEVCLVNSCLYLEGVKNQSFYEAIPQKFCPNSEKQGEIIDLNAVLEKKQREKEQRDNREKDRRDNLIAILLVLISCLIFAVFAYVEN